MWRQGWSESCPNSLFKTRAIFLAELCRNRKAVPYTMCHRSCFSRPVRKTARQTESLTAVSYIGFTVCRARPPPTQTGVRHRHDRFLHQKYARHRNKARAGQSQCGRDC
ncbi:hypothetical protein IF1G_04738 [Cordyceps javanica]|uniref:Uncharacterized protein n=1 Tax=Cordyceps javanica TaxID=43265 RepID=A0A545V368_9HYPO|nr:hypothetical protein IF1G_04738 [Cordyceps javanica]